MKRKAIDDDGTPDHANEAEQIRAFLSEENVGHTLLMTEAILTMALRAHIELSPEMASELYLAACESSERFYTKDPGRDSSPFEIDSFLSVNYARLPVLNELERYERVKRRRRRQKAAAKGRKKLVAR